MKWQVKSGIKCRPTSFTLGEVESFIHQAMQAAEGAQGRSSAEMDGHSQFHASNLATVHEGRQGSGEDPSQEDYDGSLGSREYRSQKVSADVQRVVAAISFASTQPCG